MEFLFTSFCTEITFTTYRNWLTILSSASYGMVKWSFIKSSVSLTFFLTAWSLIQFGGLKFLLYLWLWHFCYRVAKRQGFQVVSGRYMKRYLIFLYFMAMFVLSLLGVGRDCNSWIVFNFCISSVTVQNMYHQRWFFWSSTAGRLDYQSLLREMSPRSSLKSLFGEECSADPRESDGNGAIRRAPQWKGGLSLMFFFRF